MRKVKSSDVRADFAAEVGSLMAYMDRIARALKGTSQEKSDISRLAAMVFLDLYVGFERFLSDLFLAYLNRDFSRYQKHIEDRIQQSTCERMGAWAKSRTTFEAVTHVKLADLESIVDPDRGNLTFKDADEIIQKAGGWLVPAQRRRVRSITDHDKRLINTAHAVRDFIAHQSSGSKGRMNDLLSGVTQGGHNEHLGRGVLQVNNVGAYLKAVFDDRRRIAVYAERLKEISAKM